ncbi:prealbumin-like fold domain-containing protein [Bacillus cereus]|uniref:prealbumin-like fold domain-containing protein n=1 Tax=Bacillus cereus TaxID=1396 RepID=UPI00397F58F3
MKEPLYFVAVFILAAILTSSGNVSTTAQATSENLQTDSSKEMGTLEIKLVGLAWTYSSEHRGKFEYSIGKILKDVEFTIYKDGQVYEKQRTDKDGKIYFKLPMGTYTYKQTSSHPAETFPARSYLRPQGTFPITIAFNGESYQRIIYNSYSSYEVEYDTCILHDEILHRDCT